MHKMLFQDHNFKFSSISSMWLLWSSLSLNVSYIIITDTLNKLSSFRKTDSIKCRQMWIKILEEKEVYIDLKWVFYQLFDDKWIEIGNIMMGILEKC